MWVRSVRSSTSGADSMEEFNAVLKRLAAMGDLERANWQLSVDVVAHKFAKEKMIYKVRLDKMKDESFLVFQNSVIEATQDNAVVGLFEALKKFQMRSPQSLTLDGFQVRIGDFKIRVGKGAISLLQNTITVIDVEYLGCSTVQSVQLPAIDEVGAMVIDIFKAISASSGNFTVFPMTFEASYQKFQLSSKMSAAHIALDYAYLTAFASKIPNSDASATTKSAVH
jgi:hypothetical protein